MASKTRTDATTKPANRATQDRKSVTLKMAVALRPHSAFAEDLSRTFGLEPVNAAGVREAIEGHLALAASELPPSEKALEMHLQRIVSAFVGSAFGAGQLFAPRKRSILLSRHERHPTAAAGLD